MDHVRTSYDGAAGGDAAQPRKSRRIRDAFRASNNDDDPTYSDAYDAHDALPAQSLIDDSLVESGDPAPPGGVVVTCVLVAIGVAIGVMVLVALMGCSASVALNVDSRTN